MINAAVLKTRTVKALATMARKKKILGWHEMRKEELVQSLIKLAKSETARRNAAAGHRANNGSTNGHARNGTTNGKVLKRHAGSNGTAASHRPPLKKARTPHMERRLQQIKTKQAEGKDLSFRAVGRDHVHLRDRLVVMVRDPYWLHAYWELSRKSVQRAQAAMGPYWHAARPVLRVHELSRNGTTVASRQAVRDIEVHGGVNNWYVDVHNPPRSYQLELGYAAPCGRFFCLARSNVVTTPPVGTADTFDRNWAEVAKEFDRVYAMTAASTEQEANGDLKEVLEEHLHRPMGEAPASQFGPGAAMVGRRRDFHFQVDTELIVHGTASPDTRITLRGEPVRLRPDGTFAVRFNLPDRRHVLPVVASSCDGAEQRTIVLAVDRNTKVMEPVIRDPGD